MPQIIDEARLICAKFKDGKLVHNKFYNMTLYDDNRVRIWYGRYVEDGSGGLKTQSDETVPGGRALFDSKYREKTGPRKGYKPLPVVANTTSDSKIVVAKGTLAEIAAKQIKTNSDEVFMLIKHLADVNVHQITSQTSIKYDAATGSFSTPYGLVTSNGIDKGRTLLGEIHSLLTTGTFDKRFETLVEEYMTIIPQSVGRRSIGPKEVFPNLDKVKSQNDVLDALEASLTEANKPKKEEKSDEAQEVEKLFDCVLEIVTDPAEYNRVESLYTSSRKEMHVAARLKLRKVYRVVINHMTQAYNNRKVKGNEQELWHGTSPANVLSILKSGFMISPPSTAAIAGKNFGYGVYFANASTKSLNYAHGYWSGTYARKCFLFLNNVALGNYYVPENTTRSNPPKGYDSYWAQAGKSSWLQNDEIVIFDTTQIEPTYLLEFEDN